MNFLFNTYSSVAGEKGQKQTGAETVEKLCERAQSATLLEDRRAAIFGLKSMSREYKADVGSKGMAVLIHVLTNDRMDVDIVKAALETLDQLCTSDKMDGSESPAGANSAASANSNGTDLGLMFTELFCKDSRNVTVLLSILEEVDFHVRFHTVHLLSTLLENMSAQLQDCIMTSPMGISRLIDLLDDHREVIRNEGLLLLISLTQSNAEIQKIIAFENAFERLLNIIVNEGATDGGIIVQDCLQLTLNLLRYNVSNQNFFRETSCIQMLRYLLVCRASSPDSSGVSEVPLTHETNNWTDEQKIINTVMALELFKILVSPNSPNTIINQNVMNQSNLITPIIAIALSPRIPGRVRSQAFYTAGDIIRGNKANQDLFSKTLVVTSSSGVTILSELPGKRSSNRQSSMSMLNGSNGAINGIPKPAVVAVVKSALSKDDFSNRSGAVYALQCYTYDNPDSQLLLASTFTLPPSENSKEDESESAGSLLTTAMIDWDATSTKKDPFRLLFASIIMSYIVDSNPKAKELAIAVKIHDDDAMSLLHKCMYQLLSAARDASGSSMGGLDIRVFTGILSFMAVWLYDFPQGVKEFFAEGSNLQFLIEQVIQSSGVDPLVQGLAAYIMGICFEFNDDSEPSFSRASLQSLITSRIGADLFSSRLERLKESKQFQRANSQLSFDGETDKLGHPFVYFDYAFVDLYKSTYDRITKSVISSKSIRPRATPSPSPPKDGGKAGVTSDQHHDHHQSNQQSSSSSSPSSMQTQQQHEAANALILQLKGQLGEKDKEIEVLRKKISEMELKSAEQAALQSKETAKLNNTILNLQTAISEQESKYVSLEREQEDLLVCLAEQDIEAKHLKQRLVGYGETFDDDEDEDI